MEQVGTQTMVSNYHSKEPGKLREVVSSKSEAQKYQGRQKAESAQSQVGT